jgi:hypothetical protein
MENEVKESIKLTELSYTITVDDYDKAFHEVQKKFEFGRNTIFTVLVGIVGILNLITAIQKYPDNNNNVMLVAICIAFIAILWVMPFKRRKTLREALSTIEDDSYETEIYDDKIKICVVPKINPETNEPFEVSPKIIFYETDLPYVIEIPDEFIIYIKKQMFYVIPKRFLSEEQIEILRKEFSEKAKKFYPQK